MESYPSLFMTPMIRVHIKLNASLRRYDRANSKDGLVPLELEEGVTVREVVGKLGVPLEEVKMVIRNGKGVGLDTVLWNGDRVAFFPPEMAFNMYVAISFRRDL